MISKEEFCEKANSLIKDEDRKEYVNKKKRKTLLLSIFLPIILIIEALLAVFVSYTALISLVAVLPIVCIIICGTNRFKWENFKQKYSKDVFNMLLEDYEYKYAQNSFIHKDIFNASRFTGRYDDYSGEDYFEITIKNDDGTPSGTKFAICDLHVTREETRVVTDKDGHTHTETYTVTVYSGAFGYIKFPFNFKCSLGLNTNNFSEERIKLEDIDFNKRFKTYTDNQIEALCILTPTMMTKLKALDKQAGILKMSLRNDNLYLGLSRNIFEPNKKIKQLSGQVFSRIYDDVQIIFEIAEEIKNNNKVFKM